MSEKVTEERSESVEDRVEERGGRKVREGYVISDKMDKTIVVAIEDRVKHRLYGKIVRQTSRLKAHDEAEQLPPLVTAYASWRPGR